MTINDYFALFFMLVACVCAALAVRATVRPNAQNKPTPADASRPDSQADAGTVVHLLRPATTFLVLLAVIVAAAPLSVVYKGAIVLGLALALMGDLLASIPGTPPLIHLGHLLLVYLLYGWAFTSQLRMQPSLLWGGVIVLCAIALYAWLAPRLRDLRGSVIVYTIILCFMAGTGLALWVQLNVAAALFALLGTLLFAARDSALAVDFLRRPLPFMPAAALGLYLIAQILIGLSVIITPPLLAALLPLFTG